MIDNVIFNDMLGKPVREIRGRVEIYENSTLTKMCGCHDALQSFSIERLSEEGKFFGYGICQKLSVKLIDTKREIDVSTANYLEAVFGIGSDYIYAFPNFYVKQVRRDENTNEISITAYDALYEATAHTFAELEMPTSYTIGGVAEACATLLGLPLKIDEELFTLYYELGANFEGTENIRDVLNAIAEATQTIYFVNHDWQLEFKRLDKDGDAVFTIDKEKYFELESGTNRRLAKIVSATELGDNISAELDVSGTTQYIRDNPFLELREDVATLVADALAAVGGLTINQFTASWRGDFLVEIGDKLALTQKNGDFAYSYLLNDTIEFDGSLRQETKWSYEEDDAESEDNSVSLGDALKQTFARVDKANKQIDLVVSQTNAMSNQMAQLRLDTDSINASVSKTQENLVEVMENTNSEIQTLTKMVETSMTAEDVSIQIKNEMASGVDKVITSTGFTFNEEGLTVSKSDSEMETTITEDGMTVYRNEEAVLTANNQGVDAVNLHATTYLIIGTNSRFEDYGDTRTGCFWIGG